MNKLFVLGACAVGLYAVFTWKPSALNIARGMNVDSGIVYKDKTYQSEWSQRSKSIDAYVRRIDRHYDKNMPIVTYDFVLTTGDYNNPDIVKVRHKGGGNYSYSWRSEKAISGDIVFYHTIPDSSYTQELLDGISEGEEITLRGKISTNNKITSSSGDFIELRHDNHKFILVEDVEIRH